MPKPQAHFASILARDLRAARREIEAYASDDDLWRIPAGVANSAGTLALHLAGNVRYFIGAVLGGSGYVRDRDAEFGRRGVARAELLGEFDLAIGDVERVLPGLGDEVLGRPFPARLGKMTVNTGEFLVHLVAHFGYHLGQIDYHRRLVSGQNVTIHAQSVSELRSAQPAA